MRVKAPAVVLAVLLQSLVFGQSQEPAIVPMPIVTLVTASTTVTVYPAQPFSDPNAAPAQQPWMPLLGVLCMVLFMANNI